MTLENLLKDVHRAAEQKARIDTCVELYLEGSLPLLIAASKSRLSTADFLATVATFEKVEAYQPVGKALGSPQGLCFIFLTNMFVSICI